VLPSLLQVPPNETRIIQYTKTPPFQDEWVTYTLERPLLLKIMSAGANEWVQIPDVDGARTWIVNERWLEYSMYQKRERGGKRGVRVTDLQDAPPALQAASVALNSGPSININTVEVSAARQPISRPHAHARAAEPVTIRSRDLRTF